MPTLPRIGCNPSLADVASDAWSHGERCRLPNLVSERDAELRADFAKADTQA